MKTAEPYVNALEALQGVLHSKPEGDRYVIDNKNVRYIREDIVLDAIDAYRSQQGEDKWLDVSNGNLPPVNERVELVVYSLGESYVCIGKMKEDGLFYKDKGTMFKPMEVISHWKTLSELPKQSMD